MQVRTYAWHPCSFRQMTHVVCRECFFSYIGTKISRRIESNKLGGPFHETPKTLLLPVSFGVSSIVLLNLLNQHLQRRQGRNGRALYCLHIVFVNESVIGDESCSDIWSLLLQRYPKHTFSSISLEDIFDYDTEFCSNPSNVNLLNTQEICSSKSERLLTLLQRLPSPTSKRDLASNLRSRLIVAFAKAHNCTSILYGDSATRLAERTLSETAKGRGGSLPWLTSDGLSPLGVKIVYPLRDLLKHELLEYSNLTTPSLTPLIVEVDSAPKKSASSKDTTIDDLMGQYFESVEQNYPSIVANVVRTSGRLLLPATCSDDQMCSMCRLPIQSGSDGLHWSGEQTSQNRSTTTVPGLENADTASRDLCYGCARTVTA